MGIGIGKVINSVKQALSSTKFAQNIQDACHWLSGGRTVKAAPPRSFLSQMPTSSFNAASYPPVGQRMVFQMPPNASISHQSYFTGSQPPVPHGQPGISPQHTQQQAQQQRLYQDHVSQIRQGNAPTQPSPPPYRAAPGSYGDVSVNTQKPSASSVSEDAPADAQKATKQQTITKEKLDVFTEIANNGDASDLEVLLRLMGFDAQEVRPMSFDELQSTALNTLKQKEVEFEAADTSVDTHKPARQPTVTEALASLHIPSGKLSKEALAESQEDFQEVFDHSLKIAKTGDDGDLEAFLKAMGFDQEKTEPMSLDELRSTALNTLKQKKAQFEAAHGVLSAHLKKTE